VLFPLNLRPLTYRWPSDRGPLHPGMLVRAEVKKSLQHGIVIGKTAIRPAGRIKEIHDIVLERPLFSAAMSGLLRWMSAYYFALEGVVLKNMALTEYLEKSKTAKSRTIEQEAFTGSSLPLPSSSPAAISRIRASLREGIYRTFLFHAPTTLHELSCVVQLLKETKNVIILVPEISHIDWIAPVVKASFGERLAVLHGQLARGRRKQALEAIVSGRADIVLGTRLAVFAPLAPVSLIAVLQEHNQSYKNPEGVRYHARDVAVMRGYLEKSTVLLSSVAPSLESFSNTVKDKYVALSFDEGVRKPRVEVVAMGSSPTVTPYLSRRAVQAASACIREGRSALFFVNRKGYSLIQCADCGDIPSCPKCSIPLTYHKSGMTFRCHYCNFESAAGDRCMECGSTRLETVGAGTQRIAADLKRYLQVEPLRLDKDTLSEDRALKGLRDITGAGAIVVGTKALSGMLKQGDTFRLVVFVNPDIGLHMPDFRSAEFLYQEIRDMSEHVMSDGLLIIQTRLPGSEVYRWLKRRPSSGFYAEELAKRKSLAYPPFSRMIAITLSSKADLVQAVLKKLPPAGDTIEVIGPLDLAKKGTHVCKVILKSTAKEKLHIYAGKLLENLRSSAGSRVVVDVDPIEL
ncbi:MAG TPA: primosomal protein N', partial [Thermodesulfovibrionales bacterium]|nr:primosomal protein N' [Thermodesulfovibrionales bacterium]